MMTNIYFNESDYRKINYNSNYDRAVSVSSDIFTRLSSMKGIGDSRYPARDFSYAFSYYYLSTWLYLYCKHEAIIENFDSPASKVIKSITGVSPNNKTFDYITKPNGLLDSYNLTETLTYKNAPVKKHVDENGIISFTTEEQFYAQYEGIPRKNLSNTKIKKPLQLTNDRYINGLQYGGIAEDRRMSYVTDFEVFKYCTNNKDIGLIGFTVYCYLLLCKASYGKTFKITQQRISDATLVSVRELKDILKSMNEYGMINMKSEGYNGFHRNTSEFSVVINYQKFK